LAFTAFDSLDFGPAGFDFGSLGPCACGLTPYASGSPVVSRFRRAKHYRRMRGFETAATRRPLRNTQRQHRRSKSRSQAIHDRGRPGPNRTSSRYVFVLSADLPLHAGAPTNLRDRRDNPVDRKVPAGLKARADERVRASKTFSAPDAPSPRLISSRERVSRLSDQRIRQWTVPRWARNLRFRSRLSCRLARCGGLTAAFAQIAGPATSIVRRLRAMLNMNPPNRSIAAINSSRNAASHRCGVP
jgi:hypothetical protein